MAILHCLCEYPLLFKIQVNSQVQFIMEFTQLPLESEYICCACSGLLEKDGFACIKLRAKTSLFYCQPVSQMGFDMLVIYFAHSDLLSAKAGKTEGVDVWKNENRKLNMA